jgi:predicted nucleotidyltransferase
VEIENKTTLLVPIIPLLSEKIEFALLFGSANNNRLMPESDIDIGGYLKKEKIDYTEYFEFKNSLFSLSEREIDLVVLNKY